MVAPEPTLDGWIHFCENLTSYENFALIGLLFTRSRPPLSILATSDIVTDENLRNAEKWSQSNLRKLLLFYCRNYKRPEAQAVAGLVETSDAIKQLVPLLVSTLAVPVGIAVAFMFWATRNSLDDWCKKYSEKRYNGQGKYKGNFPEREVAGYFDVTYLPPITEFVEDPAAYPLKGYRIQIKVKSETDGKLKVPSSKELNSIQFSFTYDRSHSFDFKDTISSQTITGTVENLSHVGSDGPNVIRFTSPDMTETDFSHNC